MSRTFIIVVLTATAFAQENPLVAPEKRVEITKPLATPDTRAEIIKPVLTPETRGDIYMARKMYREAIETFSEGGAQKDPVLMNKVGIAYHQMMQLDSARKSYE